MSERINQTIGAILRIYKGWRLDVIQEVIHNRLNDTYHTSLKTTPNNLAQQFKKDENFKFKTEQADRDTQKMNVNREEHIYLPGQEVLEKRYIRSKIESLYTGPYTITEVDEAKQVLTIRKD